MIDNNDRLTALINNLEQWPDCSGAFHLEQEDIPIVLDALIKYKSVKMVREIAERR